jgi:hypothetical protein
MEMMMEIITNNQWRNLKYGYEMPEKFRNDFDYIDQAEFDTHDFVVYRGQWYDVNEFMSVEGNSPFTGWYGYASDSFFSGIVIKLSDDNEKVIIGRYFS